MAAAMEIFFPAYVLDKDLHSQDNSHQIKHVKSGVSEHRVHRRFPCAFIPYAPNMLLPLHPQNSRGPTATPKRGCHHGWGLTV